MKLATLECFEKRNSHYSINISRSSYSVNNHNLTQDYNFSFYLLLDILESLYLVPDFGKYDEVNKMYFLGGWGGSLKMKKFTNY